MDKAKILIVENEITIAYCMNLILSCEGFSICGIVKTGEEAVDTALKIKPDLVLMEIRLKGKLDGIMACEQIKKAIDIPVVFVTTCLDEHTIDEAMRTNPSGYITKPFRCAELIHVVEMALGGDKRNGGNR
jgi:two-component system, response regulator PdtaR